VADACKYLPPTHHEEMSHSHLTATIPNTTLIVVNTFFLLETLHN
jgi:hypothetical protein